MPTSRPPDAPRVAPDPAPGASSRDRVDIRPTAMLLRESVERYGADLTCQRFGLCRRRLGAIVTLRTTRGKHAHFLERGCVEDIMTHSSDTFGVMHVPLAGRLQDRLADLMLQIGPSGLAELLEIDLPRDEQFVRQIVRGRAGNGARITHVCASIAQRSGIDPQTLEDFAIERGWCPTCSEQVLVAGDRRCPWCDTGVSLTDRAISSTTTAQLIAHYDHPATTLSEIPIPPTETGRAASRINTI